MRVIKKCAVFNQTVSQTNFDLEFLLKYQWICLLNTIPMVSITYFYDYWFQNYKSKCQESQTFIAWIYHTGLTAIYGGYSSNFSSGRFILGPFMGGGSGAEPQQLEAARRRRKFKDRLGHPAISKHFKAQIFTYVKL